MTSPPRPPAVRWSSAWAEARALVWANRWRLLAGLGLMLVNQAAGLVLPWSTKYLIDDVIGQRRFDLVNTLALAIGLAAVVRATTVFAQSQLLGLAGHRAVADLRRRVAAHVLRLPVGAFDRTQTGTLVARIMKDTEGVEHVLGTGLVDFAGNLATAALALAILFYINWRLTLGTVVVLGVFGGALTIAFRALRPLLREKGQIFAEVSGRLTQTFGGVRVVKTYTAERREGLVFASGAHRLLRNAAKTMTGFSALGAFTDIIVGAIGVLVVIVGGQALAAGEMTVGDLVRYLSFTAMMALPIVQITSIGTQITEAMAGLDRIHELLGSAREDAGDAGREPVADLAGEIAFDHVSFEYTPGVPVLKDVTFTARAGSTTALVGSSGSGKSTILNLILAFDRPSSGTIRVDGRDLRSLRLAGYRRHLGVVLQDPVLFDGTIAENIAFGSPHATTEAIEEASRVAHVDEFAMNSPDGYATIIGERGVKLSGGQRQRVAIARAILADPRVLLLDEATSSLDSDSERQIQEGLRALRRGRTTFVIAHRLSTIRSADQILVIEDGQVVERGTHDELVARGGRYRHLYDIQSRVEGDRFVNPGEELRQIEESETPR